MKLETTTLAFSLSEEDRKEAERLLTLIQCNTCMIALKEKTPKKLISLVNKNRRKHTITELELEEIIDYSIFLNTDDVNVRIEVYGCGGTSVELLANDPLDDTWDYDEPIMYALPMWEGHVYLNRLNSSNKRERDEGRFLFALSIVSMLADFYGLEK